MEKPRFTRIFARAASSLTNLAVVGASAITAAALSSWPVALIGGLTYAALVAWDCANPDFWRKVAGKGAPDAVKLPDPKSLADPGLGRAVTAIVAARVDIAKAVKEAPEEIRGDLVGVVAQIAELERHAAGLVRRGDQLFGYLGRLHPDQLRASAEYLDERARATSDAEARAQYVTAKEARQRHLDDVEALRAARERITAQLSTIVAALEALPTKIVRMGALDAQAKDELQGNVNEELTRMNGEIRVFEETLKSMVEVAQ